MQNYSVSHKGLQLRGYFDACILAFVYVCMCCSRTAVSVRQCAVCYRMIGSVNVTVCYLFCVCFSVCADRQLLLRTFKCLLIAAIT